MGELPSFFSYSFWVVMITIILSVLFLWLFVIGRSDYTVEDTEADSEEYGGLIREGRGGMTVFLWVSFAALFIWAIYYLVVNGHQFLLVIT